MSSVANEVSAFFGTLDKLLLQKNLGGLKSILSSVSCAENNSRENSVNLAVSLCNGSYLSLVQNVGSSELSVSALLSAVAGNSTYTTINKAIVSYVTADVENEVRFQRYFECLVVGIAYLELFCQVNYTGPELPPNKLELFCSDTIAAKCVEQLECDGTYAFRSVELPQSLLFARAILSSLSDPSAACWSSGIELDESGNISRVALTESQVTDRLTEERSLMQSVSWWNVRTAVVHARLLQKHTSDTLPTLWKECQEGFHEVLQAFCGFSAEQDICSTAKVSLAHGESDFAPVVATAGASSMDTVDAVCSSGKGNATWVASLSDAVNNSLNSKFWQSIEKQLISQAWLEWGLCCLHFEYGDKVYQSKSFYSASFL
jgi:hypothetical protein